MRFHNYLNYPTSTLFKRKDLLTVDRQADGTLNFRIPRNVIQTMPVHEKREFEAQCSLADWKIILPKIHCIQQVLGMGPKVLCLNQVDFKILEQTNLSLLIKDYNQPYKAMVIEFPESYQKSKENIDPLSGLREPAWDIMHTETHYPVFAIIVHERQAECLVITVVTNTMAAYTVTFEKQDELLEEQIARSCAGEAFKGSLAITKEEMFIYGQVIRSSFNACLFADEFGLKRLGPQNPAHRKRLEHFVDVAERSGDKEKIREARSNLRMHPMMFQIDQDIKLTVKHEASLSNGTGREVKPHWRKGHYRMVPYGPINVPDRPTRRTRIDAVFVNRHKFGGSEDATRVTLHD